MGEVAEMMLDGTLDPETGEWNGFEDGEEPGFPMTGAEAARYQRELASADGRPRGKVRPLRGDWAVLARFVGEGRAHRKEARQGLEWSKRKVGGIIATMEEAGLMATGASDFWLTPRGVRAWKETR